MENDFEYIIMKKQGSGFIVKKRTDVRFLNNLFEISSLLDKDKNACDHVLIFKNNLLLLNFRI